ncbi:hypothetical protein [Encephalitozoon cuniculi GB-M1]|uniref:Ricin B lectin domain-containing protein n=1 Tax=Encephalitozoon cuniculi (strain GB-M1) TaxID=284813 RepID=Q8SUK1_ENCCU|nr:uncharacterized protein ECU08_1730 [Encephalitozoon cuniculi GB-M1]CAD26477.1 hypothetical protein [Encephalitozoon cuniculi GB-M1]
MMLIALCMMGVVLGFKITAKNNEGKFLINNNGKAVMSESGKPAEFKTDEVSPGVKIVTDKNTNKVLDIEGSKTNLIFYSRHGQENQRFTFVGGEGDVIYIKSGDGCLEYDSNGKMYRTTCSAKDQQRFKIVYSLGDPGYKPPVEVPVPAAPENPSTQDLLESPSSQALSGSANAHAPPQVLIFNGKKSHRSHSWHHNPYEDESSIYGDSDCLIV